LADIVGIENVDALNEASYQAAIAAEVGFSNPPLLAEVQAIINAVNANNGALAEVLEDSSSTGGANDSNSIPVSAIQLADITGIVNRQH